MADEAGEKTEAPTPRRLQEARDAGQVARSQDLSIAAGLLAAVLLIANRGPYVVDECREMMLESFDRLRSPGEMSVDAVELLVSAAVRVGLQLAPILLGLVVVAIVVNLAQVGFHPSSKKIQPKWEALNPMTGLSRIFGRGQGVVTLAMNLVKMLLIVFVCYSAVAGRTDEIIGAQQLDYDAVFVLGARILYDLALRIAALLLVLAVLDYAYQKYKLIQSLKMTKQQVKDELKSFDGDPHVKQRRRQIAMQRHVQRIKSAVPTADFVVTNPTHYAIAIQYDPTTMTAPKVVAKGADFLAQRIRELAVAHGIPLLERPPLARALYRTVEVGQEVPEEYYAAIAEILAYVYEISGKSRVRVPA